MKRLTLWHNPRCSKSRSALELIQAAGVEPEVVLYLQTPPSAELLEATLNKLGLEPRDILRSGEAPYRELGLADPAKTRAELIEAMTRHPILIERPIVIAGERAIVGRPPERVKDLL